MDDAWKEIEERKTKRSKLMPTEQDAINMMFECYQRLEDLGWKHAMYAPKNGKPFLSISVGSTGIHKGRFYDEKYCFVEDGGDLWPSDIYMFKEIK